MKIDNDRLKKYFKKLYRKINCIFVSMGYEKDENGDYNWTPEGAEKIAQALRDEGYIVTKN